MRGHSHRIATRPARPVSSALTALGYDEEQTSCLRVTADLYIGWILLALRQCPTLWHASRRVAVPRPRHCACCWLRQNREDLRACAALLNLRACWLAWKRTRCGYVSFLSSVARLSYDCRAPTLALSSSHTPRSTLPSTRTGVPLPSSPPVDRNRSSTRFLAITGKPRFSASPACSYARAGSTVAVGQICRIRGDWCMQRPRGSCFLPAWSIATAMNGSGKTVIALVVNLLGRRVSSGW